MKLYWFDFELSADGKEVTSVKCYSNSRNEVPVILCVIQSVAARDELSAFMFVQKWIDLGCPETEAAEWYPLEGSEASP